MKKSKNQRGFNYIEFKDSYGAKCSIQKSSSAMQDKIWFGVNDADPKIMATDAKKLGIKSDENNGWVKYPIPEQVLLNTRMHLTQKQAKKIIKVLKRFVKTGDL